METWTPYPGAQTMALSHTAREIFFGGARGPGKSWVQRLWLARLAVAQNSQGQLMYPTYKGAIFRYVASDLRDWHTDAEKLYCGKLGAKPAGQPREYRFPGGPLIRSGHLENGGYIHYVGWEIHKGGIDEATHLPTVNNRDNGAPECPDYQLLSTGSLRLSPDGNPQMFLTGNPGFKGDRWVKHRFIKVFKDGELIPPRTTFRDPISGHSRVFINATVFDNPWIMENDPGYVKSLMELSPTKQKAWIYGDWDAYEGQFFEDFDVNVHVIDPQVGRQSIPAYVHRWLSCDWGYAHACAVYGFAQGLDGRVHVYKELSFTDKTGSFEVGMEIAKAFVNELDGVPENNLVLYLSHDAFQKEDEGDRRVDTMRAGIQAVLGQDSCFILEMNDDEKEEAGHDPDSAVRRMNLRRSQSLKTFSITIVRASKNSVDGWDYARELLRTQQVVLADEPDADVIQNLRRATNSEALVANYLSGFRRTQEVVPKILIHNNCKHLIETIPEMTFDPKDPEKMLKVEGDDWCFVAGTLIRTESGERPIETLAPGDRVYARSGIESVEACGLSQVDAEVLEASFSDGTTLVGTRNHPVWVEGIGWKRLDSLSYGDMLFPWSKSSNSRASNSGVIRSRRGGILERIFGVPGITESRESVPFIRKFGRATTGLSRRVSTFTTRTKTLLITPSRTLNSFQSTSTDPFIQRLRRVVRSTWLPSSLLPLSGIGPVLGVNGIASMEFESPLGYPWSMRPAKYATGVTKQPTPKLPGCVARSAGQKIAAILASTTLKRAANAAVRLSRRIATTLFGSAPVRVLSVKPKGRSSVFNLRVANAHEYFANGILVHNCDAWMYGVMAHRNQQNNAPLAYYVGAQLQEAFKGRQVDMSSAHLINLQAQDRYQREFGASEPMRLGRFAGRGMLA